MAEGTRIQIFGNAAGTTLINTLHLMESVPTQNWQALATKVDTEWCARFSTNFQSNLFTWTGCQISWVSVNGPTSQFFPFNRVGGNSGLLPMQLAWVIRLTSGISGRSWNGRWYLGGLSTVCNQNGMPSASFSTTMANQLALIKQSWGIAVGGQYTAAIYSRKRGVMQPILDFRLAPIFGTVRSRRFGVGI